MIKIKIELNSEKKPIVILWLDGEFQTIVEGRTVEDCIERARAIRTLIPYQELEISKEAVLKLEELEGVTITP